MLFHGIVSLQHPHLPCMTVRHHLQITGLPDRPCKMSRTTYHDDAEPPLAEHHRADLHGNWPTHDPSRNARGSPSPASASDGAHALGPHVAPEHPPTGPSPVARRPSPVPTPAECQGHGRGRLLVRALGQPPRDARSAAGVRARVLARAASHDRSLRELLEWASRRACQ